MPTIVSVSYTVSKQINNYGIIKPVYCVRARTERFGWH